MPEYTYSGVHIEEIPNRVRTIQGVATSITAFIGRAMRGPTNEPITITNFGDFDSQFGGLSLDYPMSYAVRDFYLNGGTQAILVRQYIANGAELASLYALEKADLFNLLCIPPHTRNGDTPGMLYQKALQYCADRRAMLIVDPPAAWSDVYMACHKLNSLGLSGNILSNAALYFPRVKETDPLQKGQIDMFVPCGIVAGVIARNDLHYGVWKAPAGSDATINGVRELAVNLNDKENNLLYALGINCLRSFPGTRPVVWGGRTLRGSDELTSEWKYISVRRTALFIEESLYRGLKWVVFEPNDASLWAKIRLSVHGFMQNLFRDGAFRGQTPSNAFFVKCDETTMTQSDINSGIVNILVGFAPIKPAEFVIIHIQQVAGQVP